MTGPNRKFHLAYFGTAGSGGASRSWMNAIDGYDWRYPEIFRDIAHACERACFDCILLADGYGVPDEYGGIDHYVREGHWTPNHDSIPVLGLLSGLTRHIGLVSTITTTFMHPYIVARTLSSLDHLTRGRAGWNVVTGGQKTGAQNVGLDDLPPHDTRYDIADEYMEVCRRLWAAWEPDALILDRTTGQFADPAKVHHIDFVGEHFKSRGPMNIPACPQGTPVIISAGQSPRGRRFAAEQAELTVVQSKSLPELKALVADMRARIAAAGRDPSACKIFCLTRPIVGETSQIAQQRRRHYLDQLRAEDGLATISMYSGHDLSRFPLDEPLPKLEVNTLVSLFQRHYADGANPTLREIMHNSMGYDGYPLCGTPEELADEMQTVINETGADGFFIRPGLTSVGDLITFIDSVVPILQMRGAVRSEYTGETFRHHLQEF